MTSSLFAGLSSPGICHNKIPGLSRFSRTRTNPEFKFTNELTNQKKKSKGLLRTFIGSLLYYGKIRMTDVTASVL